MLNVEKSDAVYSYGGDVVFDVFIEEDYSGNARKRKLPSRLADPSVTRCWNVS